MCMKYLMNIKKVGICLQLNFPVMGLEKQEILSQHYATFCVKILTTSYNKIVTVFLKTSNEF